MTFEIIIWKFVINLSILRKEKPKEIDSSVFYRLFKNEVRGIREPANNIN